MTENPYCKCGLHLGMPNHETSEHEEAKALYRRGELKESNVLVTAYHDTLEKVYNALQTVGLDRDLALDAINAMQNNGVLFMERKR